MPKYDIAVHTESCTGCWRCELACSYTFHKSFNPSLAWIKVAFSGQDVEINFTEECLACGACADNCLYGALEKSLREAD